jgi:hypothetical protein
MHQIEVDAELLTWITRCARPGEAPNDVLRRLLGVGTPSGPVQVVTRDRKAGDLRKLLHAGLIDPDDQLVHEQPRLGRTHRATVRFDGCVELPDRSIWPSPSGALSESVGSQQNGWDWTHEKSGRTLGELRKKLGDAAN